MYAIILAGGSGTRLWPLSRDEKPKQLLSLFGEDSLLKMTINRLLLKFKPENILVVANPNHKDILEFECQDLPRENIIYESASQGTAGALFLGALKLYERDKNASFVLINSDHIITDTDAYHGAIEKAVTVAEKNPDRLVLVGVSPSYPETGYGYIKVGEAYNEEEVFFVERFVEKPNFELAKEYVESGKYLWNLTLIVGKIKTLLAIYDKFLPEYNELAQEKIYKLPAQTIDYGILEKMDNLLVIPANFNWVDVGHFRAVHSILKNDAEDNVIRGEAITFESSGNLIINTSGKKTIATIGLNNFAVIETPDALLVCPLDRAQDVRQIVKKLQDK